MEPPSTPPGPSTRASCSGPSAARDERDKTRSPRPPGPGPTGQLVLSIYLWSSFCMYRSHFRLQIKSRDNQPGWTRTLPGRAGSLTAAGRWAQGPLRPGIHSLHRVFLWRVCGGSSRIPTTEGGPFGRERRAGVVCFPVESHAAVCPSPPSPVQLHPSFPQSSPPHSVHQLGSRICVS